MTMLLPNSSRALDPPQAPHGGLAWRHYAGAATSALCVGILAFMTLGGLFMSLAGVGLLRLGAPAVAVWSVIAVVGAVAIMLSGQLACRVWRLEMEAATTQQPGHHVS